MPPPDPDDAATAAGRGRPDVLAPAALRPLFAYLRAVVVPTAVFAASEDWAGGPELVERIDRAASELADLLSRRPAAPRRDPFDDPTPFEAMLHRG